MILNQNIAACQSFNNDKEDITLSKYFMNAMHMTSAFIPQATYDAMLYWYSQTIGHDITSDADES
jgi:hypothetical protein